MAGSNWGSKMQKMRVPEATPNSVKYKFHQQDPKNKLNIFVENPQLNKAFSKKMGHRAIGVVYHPRRERGNYVPSKLSERYDTFLFIDETKALYPLKIEPDGHLMPETFPFGISMILNFNKLKNTRLDKYKILKTNRYYENNRHY